MIAAGSASKTKPLSGYLFSRLKCEGQPTHWVLLWVNCDSRWHWVSAFRILALLLPMLSHLLALWFWSGHLTCVTCLWSGSDTYHQCRVPGSASHVAQAGLKPLCKLEWFEFLLLLPSLALCWDYRHAPFLWDIGIKLRSLCMLDKHSTDSSLPSWTVHSW